MKKRNRILFVLVLLLAFACAAAALAETESILLSETTLTLSRGASERLTATVEPDGASRKLSWSSSDTVVATVASNGTVRAKSAGECIITCASTDGSGIAAQCAVTVNERVTAVTMAEKTAELLLGAGSNAATTQLTATPAPKNATITALTWASDKPEIATVDENGVVTAVSAGSCVITATTQDPDSRASGRCTVHVRTAVSELTLSQTEAVVYTGKTLKLKADATPKDAYNKKVTWTSSDPSVATVNASGVVSPRTPGTTVITCTAADGGSTAAACTVTVKAHASKVTVSPTRLSLVVGDSGTGSAARLDASVTPEGADITTVNYTSSAPAIVAVDAEGNLTALQKGTATITVRSDDPDCKSTAKCTVTVGRAVDSVSISGAPETAEKGRSFRLMATVLPKDATSKKVTWTSSDPAILKVDANGTVHALKTGTATITLQSADGSGATASCTVTVIQHVTSIRLTIGESVLMAGEETVLTATVLPADATDARVEWSSSDTSVALVDANGRVTTLSAGSAKITCAALDGSGKSASLTVTAEPTDPVKLAAAGVGIRSDSMTVLTFENICAKRKVKEVDFEYHLYDARGNELTNGMAVVKEQIATGGTATALVSLRSASNVARYRFSVARVVFTDGTEYTVPGSARRVTTWKR